MRPPATERSEARRRVEELLSALPGDDADRLSFERPWELRAFALAVAAYHAGQYEWSQFQLALIASIRRWEESGEEAPWAYYDHWLEALEATLSASGALAGTELQRRTEAVLAAPPGAGHHRAHPEPVAIDPAR